MIKKERRLPYYLQFDIVAKKIGNNFFPLFFKVDGREFREWDIKLTPSQWKKASKCLTRTLIPFCGYKYSFKEGFGKEEGIAYQVR